MEHINQYNHDNDVYFAKTLYEKRNTKIKGKYVVQILQFKNFSEYYWFNFLHTTQSLLDFVYEKTGVKIVCEGPFDMNRLYIYEDVAFIMSDGVLIKNKKLTFPNQTNEEIEPKKNIITFNYLSKDGIKITFDEMIS